jgi:hydroxymethylbilane synthase
MHIRLGTRGSPLAKWQAESVASRLSEQGVEVELVLITTTGDVTKDSLSVAGGQGLFTKEIQRALLDERIDLAVHSLKDLPTDQVEGLALAAVPLRESPLDAFVSNRSESLEKLTAGCHVGTGSRRRQSQVLHLRPDLRVSEIRGNVDTRLRKLDEGQYDAIILAEAGLKRLGYAERISQVIPPFAMLPAVGQGALGLEVRSDDESIFKTVQTLDHPPTHAAVTCERTLLAELRAGCMAPVGAWARVEGNRMRLSAAVLSGDGRRRVAVSLLDQDKSSEELGRLAARELLALGAAELIAESRKDG